MGFFAKQRSSRIGLTQKIAFDASTAVANPFGSQTYQIRLSANSACHYQIGDGAQTATTASPFLAANAIEYITVAPGQRISAIKAATDGLVTAAAGTLWISELD